MKRLLVTGGCGFIGSNFVRLELGAYPDVEITNLDALTYAGYPDNLADLTDPALSLRPGRRRRPGRSSATCWPRGSTRSSTSRPRATSIARSATRRRFLRTNVVGTQSSSTRPARRDSAVRPRLDRRGLRHPRPDDPPSPSRPRLPRTARTPPARPAPTCSSAPRTTRTGWNGHHPLLEQLRPLPVPREAHPAVHHQRPGRHPAARLRRRPPGPRLDPRARPLPGGRRGVAARAGRRDLQFRRALRALQHRRDARASSN